MRHQGLLKGIRTSYSWGSRHPLFTVATCDVELWAAAGQGDQVHGALGSVPVDVNFGRLQRLPQDPSARGSTNKDVPNSGKWEPTPYMPIWVDHLRARAHDILGAQSF